MIKVLCAFFALIIVLSCNSHEGQPKNNMTDTGTTDNNLPTGNTPSPAMPELGYFKVDGDSLIIPPIEIEVSLSEKASEKLDARHETIMVAAYFSGVPKDTTSEEYAQSGQMGVTNSTIELSDSRVARFEGIKFSKALYDSLADKDISLLINIFSGRHSTQNNLLDCDILEDKVSSLKDRKFTVKGKLIGEH